MKAILLNRVLLVLAFVGLFIAGVLSLEAGMNLVVPCGPSGGCAKVAADPSSRWILGIPNAYLGVLGYLLLAGLSVHRALRPVDGWRPTVTLGYIVATVGTIYSIGLQYYSLTQIHAACMWCLSSAVTMVVILITYAMLAQEMENLPKPGDPTPSGYPRSEVTDTMGYRIPGSDLNLMIALPVLAIVGIAIMGSVMKSGSSFHFQGDYSKVDLAPKGSNSFGVATAPVTLVEFADLCCPACQRTSPQVKEFVIQHPGQVRLIYRHYPLPMHELSEPAAVISECMADENRFWDYAIAVMSLNRQPKDINELLDIAKGLGADTKKISKRLEDVNDPAYSRVEKDLAAVKQVGITSTPTFFVMTDGKVQDVVGPTEILGVLNSSKYADKMAKAHA